MTGTSVKELTPLDLRALRSRDYALYLLGQSELLSGAPAAARARFQQLALLSGRFQTVARWRIADPILGGRFELQANSLSLYRPEGQDTQRAFASAQWTLTRITPWGQQVTVTALALPVTATGGPTPWTSG